MCLVPLPYAPISLLQPLRQAAVQWLTVCVSEYRVGFFKRSSRKVTCVDPQKDNRVP